MGFSKPLVPHLPKYLVTRYGIYFHCSDDDDDDDDKVDDNNNNNIYLFI